MDAGQEGVMFLWIVLIALLWVLGSVTLAMGLGRTISIREQHRY